MAAKLYANWSFTIQQSLIYVVVFTIWKEFPSRPMFAISGTIGTLLMAALLERARRNEYFINRTDFLMHALVTIDLLIEGWIFEIYLLCSKLYKFEADEAVSWHNHYGFTLCTTVFLAIIVCHRWPRLRART